MEEGDDDVIARKVANAYMAELIRDRKLSSGVLEVQVIPYEDRSSGNRNRFAFTVARWKHEKFKPDEIIDVLPDEIKRELKERIERERERRAEEFVAILKSERARRAILDDVLAGATANVTCKTSVQALRRKYLASVQYESGAFEIPCDNKMCRPTDQAEITLINIEAKVFSVVLLRDEWTRDKQCMNPQWFIRVSVDGQAIVKEDTLMALGISVGEYRAMPKLARDEWANSKLLYARYQAAKGLLVSLGVDTEDIHSAEIDQVPIPKGMAMDEYRQTNIWFTCQPAIDKTSIALNGKQLLFKKKKEDLRAEEISGGVRLVWDQTSTADHYWIIRVISIDGKSEAKVIADNVVDTTYVDNTGDSGQCYNYVIYGIDVQGRTRSDSNVATGCFK